MIHHLFVGHFQHEGDFVKFEKQGDSRPAHYKPVVKQRLDMLVVEELLNEKGIRPNQIPEDWWLGFESDEYLVCDRFTFSDDAIEFIKALSQRTGCEIADYSSLSFIPAEELHPAHKDLAKI